MLSLPAALAPMGAYPQFICYVLSPSTSRPGKTDKFPVDGRTGRVANAHDPAIWTDAPTACAAAARLGVGYGVGFVFTERDPFWFLDLDNCLLPDNSAWSPLALSLVAALPGAAIEVSSSGRGLHIFGTGAMPAHGCKNTALGLELYHTGRFVALTGTNAVGSASDALGLMLPWLVSEYFPPDAAPVGSGAEVYWTDRPCDGWSGPIDDDELIWRMMRAQSAASAFSGKASFRDLWLENVDALARSYPTSGEGAYDASLADSALAQHLAFWTGKDCERISRLMRLSALERPKWDREDYLCPTILKTCARQSTWLTDKQPEPLAAAVIAHDSGTAPRAKMVEGSTILDGPAQVELFAGCVYVQDAHRILTPGGMLMKPDQFKVMYGGYSMPLDPDNGKATRDAWEAFTLSQLYRTPRADSTCFKPNLAPGVIVEDAGRTRVNVWWPVETPRQVGDVGPFMRHLEKVLPDQRDRRILLSYMAACIQHKGVKFQWAPLLQGVEGNGKTLFTRCVAEAIGQRYVHWPKASQLGNKFNAWMVNKLFFGVEDIYVASGKEDLVEELKPMITGGDGLEIQAKGVDQISADVCGNFIFNSNHLNGVRKTRNDRRFCVLFSAQQEKDHLARDGMDGEYFPGLYDWLKTGGYAIVSELLHTYPIDPEFNPGIGCQRAPDTSSTNDAIDAGMGGVEQEIQESIEQGLPGFCGGWVSSMALNRLLEKLGVARSVTHNKRRDMLAAMGFEKHPALPLGRTKALVMPDGGRPILYVRKGSDAWKITEPFEAGRAYSGANSAFVTTN